MTSEIGPDYRQVMNLIRDKIASGDWPVDSQIPSTTGLREMTGLSITSVRRGVQQLQAGGILEGHPGKGVFVKALPEDADRERADLGAFGEQVAELARRVEGYDDLRARVGRVEANLMDLYNRLGFEYPHGGKHDNGKKAAAGRGRR